MSRVTLRETITQRGKAIEDYRSILAVANREGRLVTGEERAAADKARREAEHLGDLVDQMREMDELDAVSDENAGSGEEPREDTPSDVTAAAMTDYLRAIDELKKRIDEMETNEAVGDPDDAERGARRSKFVRRVTPLELPDYNERDHIKFLRGQRDVYGGAQGIAFMRPTRGQARQRVYRAWGDGDTELRALSTGTASAGATIDTPFVRKLYDYKETVSTFRALGPYKLTTSTGAPTEWPYVLEHGKAGNIEDAPLPENTAIGGTAVSYTHLTLPTNREV